MEHMHYNLTWYFIFQHVSTEEELKTGVFLCLADALFDIIQSRYSILHVLKLILIAIYILLLCIDFPPYINVPAILFYE